MNLSGFDQAVSAFTAECDDVKSQLLAALEQVCADCVPEATQVTALNDSVGRMRAAYCELCTLAESILLEPERPKPGAPASAFIQAVDSSERRRAQQQLEQALDDLRKFVAVRSRVDAYAKALAPFQEEAAAVLEQPHGENGTSAEQILAVADRTALFLNVLRIEDPDSDEGLALFERLDDVYPSMVQRGLARGNYELPEESDSEEYPCFNETVSEGSETPTPTQNDRVEPPQEMLTSETGASPVQTVKSRNKIKNANPSASAFKSDLKTMPVNVRVLLPLFTNLGALTVSMAADFSRLVVGLAPDEAEETELSLELLVNKNCLAAYELCLEDAVTTVYCLTDYGWKCMQKDSVVKIPNFWGVNFGKYRLIAEKELDRAVLVSALDHNRRLYEYLLTARDTLEKEVFDEILGSVKWDEAGYQAAVPWNGEFHLCRLTPATEEQAFVFSEGDRVLAVFSDASAQLPEPEGQCECFALKNGALYHWEGAWVASDGEEETPAAEVTAVEDTPPVIVADTSEVTPQEPQESAPAAGGSGEAADMPPNSTMDICAQFLKKHAPTDEELAELIVVLLNDSDEKKQNLALVTLFAKAASFPAGNVRCRQLYQKLLLATKLPLDVLRYSGTVLEETFPEPDPVTEDMMLAAYLYALLSPHHAYDYTLQSKAGQLLNDFELWFPDYPQVKPLFHKLCSVEQMIPGGFSDSVISRLGDEDASNAFTDQLRDRATALKVEPTIKTKMNGLPGLIDACFRPGSDLYECMEIISEDQTNNRAFVEEVLNQFCVEQDGVLEIQKSLIEERIDKEWSNATKGLTTKNVPLRFRARKQVLDAFEQRLSLIHTWVGLGGQKDQHELETLKPLQMELLKLMDSASEALQQKPASQAVRRALHLMKLRLNGQREQPHDFDDLLRTGILSLDDDRMPIMHAVQGEIKYYEPWRNVLRHMIAPQLSFEQARSQILDSNSPQFDNLHQLELIDRLLGQTDGEYAITDAVLQDAVEAAEDETRKFEDRLELAYAYNRIDETDKESIAAILDKYQEDFFAAQDFGCWRQFLKALDDQITELTADRERQLRKLLKDRRDSLEQGQEAFLLDEAERLLDEDSNFVVAEEYINRFDSGEDPQNFRAIPHDDDSFQDFLRDEVFDPLYELCQKGTGRQLKSFAKDYLDCQMPRDWTSRQRDDSLKLVSNWPTRKFSTSPEQIKNLFAGLGLKVERATRDRDLKEEVYYLKVMRTDRNLADYRHPIAAFGTQMKSPLPVVVLYGNYTDQQLVDTVTAMNLGGIAIVLLDRPVDREKRRQIAETFHRTSGQNPFLLIDQVLLLYLALHQETERLPVMLKCTLPYSVYQPFVRDGGPVADEIFCGRVKELATIIDPNGACVVYGGRQLGKTALLERAESRCSKPDSKMFAVYCNIIDCKDESSFTVKVVDEVNRKTDFGLSGCNTIQELCRQFDLLFRNGKVDSMLLLLDEADRFLDGISGDNYRALQPLIDLKRETKNNFKFVLAGLHNVCRAQNATSQNGVFGQLGTPLCVKPLSPADALQLLSRPLRYLGFQIDDNHHMETILANTNYYPGILHFFGYTLVQTLTSHYAQYYRASNGNPPFTLQDEQLGAVMNSSDLNSSIKEKFRLSLELDPRYFMLARCVALLYHFRQEDDSVSWLGFSAEEIKKMADDFEIKCLAEENLSGYTDLLREMAEMGILSIPQDGKYRLRRHSFLDIIGSDLDALEAEIIRNNEEVLV